MPLPQPWLGWDCCGEQGGNQRDCAVVGGLTGESDGQRLMSRLLMLMMRDWTCLIM